MDFNDEAADPAKNGSRFGNALARAEVFYLGSLRAITLVIATIMLIYAAWLVASGIYRSSRDASTISEAPAAVSAQELAEASPLDGERGSAPSEAKRDAVKEKFYKAFLDKYFKLYQLRFETYRQGTDKPTSKADFDEKFVRTGARLKAVQEGQLNFAQDKADMETLYKVMSEASDLPKTKERLTKYKSTQRQRVEKKIRKTRIESYCSYYGYYSDMCLDYGTREVPYTETTVVMQLPKGVQSYTGIFATYHETYLTKLEERRAANREDAERKRADILADNSRGSAALWLAIQIAAGFLVLMFFFLLIAIERHQRKIAKMV